MSVTLELDILSQPDETTCGPTCLHALYRYQGDEIPLKQVVEEVKTLEEGGTLAVLLACHALKRGYKAKIYTYNLQVFDPTWFNPHPPDLAEKLKRQSEEKNIPKLSFATEAYLEFLKLGGKLGFEDLTQGLLRHYLKAGYPILAGLSATYLYNCARERITDGEYDDVSGFPTGHFVVIYGYDRERRAALIADPIMKGKRYYEVELHRLVSAILLGIVTYDANLLILEPPKRKNK